MQKSAALSSLGRYDEPLLMIDAALATEPMDYALHLQRFDNLRIQAFRLPVTEAFGRQLAGRD